VPLGTPTFYGTLHQKKGRHMPSRIISVTEEVGVYTDYFGTRTPQIREVEAGTEELIWGAEGHYGYPQFNFPDVGGDFLVNYNTRKAGAASVGKIHGGYTAYSNHHYDGEVVNAIGPVLANASNLDASSFGATLYKKMKPDKPSWAGLNAIYELKDLPHMLRQKFVNPKKPLASVGNYWLALQFGWKPLLNDIRSLVRTQQTAQERLKQLIRDEGKPVKRRVTLQDSNDTTSVQTGSVQALYPSFVDYFYSQAPAYVNKWGTSDKIWASAQFRYWLPPGPRDIVWTARMMADIFGLYPSPEVIYNAIPWTWLIDWFSNLGDCISNLQTSLVDRLAADYFYVMRQTESWHTSECTSYYYADPTNEIVKATAQSQHRSGCKSRLKGDPFGFGTPANSLSGTQLSILGALGLSRIR
jgi:hypothetical protein